MTKLKNYTTTKIKKMKWIKQKIMQNETKIWKKNDGGRMRFSKKLNLKSERLPWQLKKMQKILENFKNYQF